MKKILLATALVLAMGLGVNAQRDSFFNDWESIDNGIGRTTTEAPTLPGSHGLLDNQSAPLGTGLLILTALGAGYALKKKRD